MGQGVMSSQRQRSSGSLRAVEMRGAHFIVCAVLTKTSKKIIIKQGRQARRSPGMVGESEAAGKSEAGGAVITWFGGHASTARMMSSTQVRRYAMIQERMTSRLLGALLIRQVWTALC